MGVCFSACEPRPRPSTPTEPYYFTSNPWDRKLPQRENPDALPRYYRDKFAREAINRRGKARLKREAGLTVGLEESRVVQASTKSSGADAGPKHPRKPACLVQCSDLEFDDRPEAVI